MKKIVHVSGLIIVTDYMFENRHSKLQTTVLILIQTIIKQQLQQRSSVTHRISHSFAAHDVRYCGKVIFPPCLKRI